jgi:type II secretory pathway component PulF
MLFSPRMSLKQLAAFSQRASMSLLAGIDERTICAREAQNARSLAARRHLATVSQMVNQGETLSAGLAAAGDFFPPLFREMVQAGEQSGHLGEVLKQLADHYQNQITLRRNFLASIAWPAVELFLAVLIVGFLIWIMGVINDMNHSHLDPLGFGLTGNSGLAKYAAFIAIVGIGLAVLIRAVARGMLWTRPLQRLMLRIPKIGPALQTVAVARLAWVMSQTMNTSMELRRALRLSLECTRNAWYIDRIEPIDAQIAAGNSIHEAFSAAGGFPPDFLDALLVGEQSGNLVESMAHESKLYQEQARAALSVLATVGGFAVWVAVAAIIVFLIFRLAMFYLSALNGAGLG